jgi:broad specificity phosphatase PhoE
MAKFLLIRHGMTDAAGKRLTGRMPGVMLNAEGILQVKELTDRITHLPIKKIYSSPLERTIATAQPIAEKLNLQIELSDDFLELDFGEWTDKLIEDLKGDGHFTAFNKLRSTTRIPGGETMLEAQTRFVAGMTRINKLHSSNHIIAIFSHADMIKAAVAYYAAISLDMFHRIEISPASVTGIEIFEDTPIVRFINYCNKLQM